jgi:hypothetical protein
MAASWETLFGSASHCACNHCRSIYGPAAYLVDLLEFLKNSGENDNHQTPLDVLRARRPDLEDIKLSCENTDTELPYVDLVNEVLESYVALNGTLDSTTAKDTGDSTADQLAANPQYLNQVAYDTLNQYDGLRPTVYPFSLPFDRSLEVLRICFEHLGSSRYDVMKGFQNKGQPSDLAIACEYLKISNNEHKILTGTDFSGAKLASPVTLPQFYGYDPSASPTAVTTLAQSLAPVPEFLQRTGLQYADLIELVKTRFLNPDQAITLDVPTDQDPCDLTKTSTKNLDRSGFLNEAHRFIRLWQKLGWTIQELDKAIRALGGTDIDDALLLKLADVKRIQADLRLPLDQLLSFWADIDTEGRDSLYVRLFQNKAVLIPLDPAFRLTYVAALASPPAPAVLTDGLSYDNPTAQLRFVGVMTRDRRAQLLPLSPPPDASFQLAVDDLFDMRQADGTSLPGSATISGHVETILAALRLRAVDLSNVIPAEVADALTVGNLSTLYRFSLLAKALKLAVADLVSLKALAGVDPFPSRTPSGTAAFLQIVRKARHSRFSVAQLNYLYRDVYDPNRGVAPVAGNVDLLLTTLQTGLKKIASDNIFASDPTGDVLRQKLAVVLDSSVVDAAFGLIAGTAVFLAPLSALPPGFTFPNAWRSKITWDAKARTLQFEGPMSDNDRTALLGLLAGDANYQAAITRLWQQPRDFITNNFASFLTDPSPNDPVSQLINTPPSPAAKKFDYVLAGLLAYLQTTQSRSLVKQALSDSLKLDSELINRLIDQELNFPSALVHALSDATKPSIVDFLHLADLPLFGPPPPSPPPGPAPDAARNSYRLLHKIALLVNGFKMTVQEVDYLSGHGSDFQGVDPSDPTNSAKFVRFDLNALPLSPSAFTPALFNQWERLYDLFTLRDSLPAGTLGLIDVFDAGSLPDAKNRLVSVTNWDAGQVEALTGTEGFNLAPADFHNEIQLVRLGTCWDVIKRFGANAQRLFSWANTAPDSDQAQDIKNAVRTKYDDQTWLTVAKALSDKLRERQKVALISYIISHIMTRPEMKSWGVIDADRLTEYFLIDVNMSACMLTSRIVQATAAVQFFVRRCLMGLESRLDSSGPTIKETGVAASSIDASEWQWREFYRVSEAAIKVFTYPENWVLEELRDDKTPFFKDLENELLQNDVNSDSVEQAFQHYLEKLDEVARLEICGMYWEQEDETAPGAHDAIDTIHVFGRTHNTPHIYYYRRFVDKSVWTAWEKVHVDIEGDHLIPAVWNRRLHLFWPLFTKVAGPQSEPDRQNNKPAPIHFEIRLAWSEYKNGKWAAKKTSRDQKLTSLVDPVGVNLWLTTPDKRDKELDQSLYTFKAFFPTPPGTDGGLIQCIHEAQANEVDRQLIGTVVGNYWFSSCRGAVQASDFTFVGRSLFMPLKSDIRFMGFGEETDPGSGDLTLVTGSTVNDPSATWDAIVAGETDIPTLTQTPSLYSILYPHQYPQYILQAPFFYQDDLRTYFVTPETVPWTPGLQNPLSVTSLYAPDVLAAQPVTGRAPGDPPIFEGVGPAKLAAAAPSTELARSLSEGALATGTVSAGPIFPISTPGSIAALGGLDAGNAESWSVQSASLSNGVELSPWEIQRLFGSTTDLRFATFYHPHVCDFVKSLNRTGVSGLLTLDNQKLIAADTTAETIFEKMYRPNAYHVEEPYPAEDIDFSNGGAYSLYNWELFFHIPLLIATRLSQNQRFEDARRWFRYIFDPTSNSGDPAPSRYWRVLPFRQNSEDGRIDELFKALDYTGSDPAILKLQKDVSQQVTQWKKTPFSPHAIARLRLMAYQKTVVMKYIDNLLAWGDYLFSQDTRETDHEALAVYKEVKDIMGLDPQIIPQRGTTQEATYNDLHSSLDSFSNAVVALENEFPFSSSPAVSGGDGAGGLSRANPGWNFYFCIPPNDQLLGYWNTVGDRLFKLRHCMNKEGVVRDLPLFQPPIDPALLVQAAAAGVDISSALADISAPTPYYRFSYMLQKALELCAEVRSLGAALLAALEKNDGEALASLRAGQESSVLQAVRGVKEKQLEEANYNLTGLNKYLDVVQKRLDWYSSRPFMNTWEIAQFASQGTLVGIYGTIETVLVIEAVAALVGNTKIAAPTSAGVTYGGSNEAQSGAANAELLKNTIDLLQTTATFCGTLGGFSRRADEWQLQADLASKELKQVAQQIAAAQVRADIAQQELDNHDLQTANAQAVQDFLHDKYTNQDLYGWMISQTSATFFQCYKLAYDMARRAERAYRFERGVTDSNFIRFGYWDSLKKGLLSGERLYLDLKRIEGAYLDQNRREYEITKHISLVLLNPLALIQLKENGQCIVELLESLFDADYPGHYMRRVKTVTVTIPCVAGPYTSINCTLTLLKSSIRVKSDPAANGVPYARDQSMDDPRFVDNFSAIESIATSHGNNDSGLFEVNFRDERYLPFEGAGAISQWRLEMPSDNNAFDFETITDVIMNLNYTSRDGGEPLREAARRSIAVSPQEDLLRMFSLRHEFPGEWYRFLHPADAAAPSQKLSFTLTIDRFPFQLRGKTISITALEVFLKWKDISDPSVFKTDGTPLGDYQKAGSPLTLKITSPSGDSPTPSPALPSDSAYNGLPHVYIDLNAQPQNIGSWMLEALATDVQKIALSLRSDGTAGPVRLKGALIEDFLLLVHYSA